MAALVKGHEMMKMVKIGEHLCRKKQAIGVKRVLKNTCNISSSCLVDFVCANIVLNGFL